MRQWTGSALVQVMTCCLFGARSLLEPMLTYCQLDSCEQISVKFESEFYHSHSRKCISNCRLPKWWSFCPGDMSWLTYVRARIRDLVHCFICDAFIHPRCGYNYLFMPKINKLVKITSVSRQYRRSRWHKWKFDVSPVAPFTNVI